jgi:hypothetical protein
MSKIASLQAGLNRAATRSAAAPAASAAQAAQAPKPPSMAQVQAKAPSREGKVHIGAYLPDGFRRSLRLVQAQTGEDTQTLIARALNELFRGHNVPVIDLD